jgi:hypothetical protein
VRRAGFGRWRALPRGRGSRARSVRRRRMSASPIKSAVARSETHDPGARIRGRPAQPRCGAIPRSWPRRRPSLHRAGGAERDDGAGVVQDQPDVAGEDIGPAGRSFVVALPSGVPLSVPHRRSAARRGRSAWIIRPCRRNLIPASPRETRRDLRADDLHRRFGGLAPIVAERGIEFAPRLAAAGASAASANTSRRARGSHPVLDRYPSRDRLHGGVWRSCGWGFVCSYSCGKLWLAPV